MKVWSPILIPALVAAVCLLVSWQAWRRRDLARNGHWGGALAFAGSYFAAHVIMLSWPAMPPTGSAEWLAWIALGLGAAGAAQRWWGAKWYVAWPVRVSISAGVCFALLQSPLNNTWGREAGWMWLAGVTIALAMQWWSLETLATIRPGASLALSLLTYCSISAGVFFIAGSAVLAQLAGGLAAAAGAATVLAWWALGLRVSGGAMAAFVPLYSGLLMRSYFLGDLSAWSAVPLYLAPFALWYGERRRFVYTRPWKAALIRMALVMVPSMVALGIAWWIAERQTVVY